MLIIGHRGACGYEPENTLSSFQKALDLNVAMIELDVYKCKSGELVVIHDSAVDKTTDGSGNVEDLTLAELKKLNCSNCQKIPTLEEVINLVDRKCKINIEIKSDNLAKYIAGTIEDYIGRGWSYDDFLVSSGKIKEIKDMFDLNYKILRGVLFTYPRQKNVDQVKELDLYFFGTYAKFITKSLVRKVHKEGIKLFAWTVNNKKLFKKMSKLKVDGVFSDYPDIFLA